MTDFTPTEMMTIAAARALSNDDVCFVGIGAASAAWNVGRRRHAPEGTPELARQRINLRSYRAIAPEC